MCWKLWTRIGYLYNSPILTKPIYVGGCFQGARRTAVVTFSQPRFSRLSTGLKNGSYSAQDLTILYMGGYLRVVLHNGPFGIYIYIYINHRSSLWVTRDHPCKGNPLPITKWFWVGYSIFNIDPIQFGVSWLFVCSLKNLFSLAPK